MLVSVVTLREPKMLRGSSCSGYGAYWFLRHGHITLPAQRADLTYHVIPAERDKSVSLPTQGKHIARWADGGADMRGRRKRMPLCNGTDTGCVSPMDNITGARKRADFLQVLHTR